MMKRTVLTTLALGMLLTGGPLTPVRSVFADAMLADFDYPHEVGTFEFTSQGQKMAMAYMDIPPSGAGNGGTVVLLHGKNFCGATWESVIQPLTLAGYRVVVPDQVGFCKSTKPAAYQFGLHQLAANTHALLEQAGVRDPIVMGHSMGGMLAMRYALMYPNQTSALVLVNPIGLEDWKAKGVPVTTVDQLYQGELKTNAEGIKRYQLNTYYAGEWRSDYDRWVEMLAGMYKGDDGDLVAWNQALTSDMVFMQPVVHELQNIQVPTLLMIGERDNTAIGKDRAPEDVAARLGNYKELARETANRIPGARLVTFPNLGHSPQVQAPEEFNAALLENLGQVSARE
ncbi:alpha/beta hydrolase [Skermanella stibiiresistens SB22]|uniref:Alpha/beta hydrolase n=1 Tax=Skermanella stibiiresistens SB22 TaxID=1385369 RepID=W9GVS3_9PROT|nr:alpha/beta hydrolase [Skermanella stibiiresistens]EWY37904.1 alpha/beta hydrolase [Skermanella stibiiresistens SB22]